MVNRLKENVFYDARIEQRVSENKQVAWFVQNSETRGIGRIRNISASGMLLETERPIDPDHQFFSFAADLGHDNFVPQRGQLIWARPKKEKSKRYLCGVRFVEPSDYILPKLEKRVENRRKSERTIKYLNKFCDGLLFCAIIGLTAYTVWMSADVYQHMERTNKQMEVVTTQQATLIQHYQDKYEVSQTELASVREELTSAQKRIAQLELDLEESRRLYSEGEQMIASINQELDSTRKALTETETMLNQALASKTEIEGLSAEQQKEFEEKRQTLSTTVDRLEKENKDLTNLMRRLESQLAYYQGDVKNTDEGELLIRTYKRNMKLVKSKIRQFKRDAQRLNRAAQKERDRLQVLLGNNGYFMKDGSVVRVDEQKYTAAGNGTYTGELQTQEVKRRKVDVNVEFVK